MKTRLYEFPSNKGYWPVQPHLDELAPAFNPSATPASLIANEYRQPTKRGGGLLMSRVNGQQEGAAMYLPGSEAWTFTTSSFEIWLAVRLLAFPQSGGAYLVSNAHINDDTIVGTSLEYGPQGELYLQTSGGGFLSGAFTQPGIVALDQDHLIRAVVDFNGGGLAIYVGTDKLSLQQAVPATLTIAAGFSSDPPQGPVTIADRPLGGGFSDIEFYTLALFSDVLNNADAASVESIIRRDLGWK